MLSLADHPLVICGGGSQTGGPWILLVRDEVDQLRAVQDWQGYLHREVTKKFDPSVPVYEAKRAALSYTRYPDLDILEQPGSRDQGKRLLQTP